MAAGPVHVRSLTGYAVGLDTTLPEPELFLTDTHTIEGDPGQIVLPIEILKPDLPLEIPVLGSDFPLLLLPALLDQTVGALFLEGIERFERITAGTDWFFAAGFHHCHHGGGGGSASHALK